MPIYKDINDDSGIRAYDQGDSWITIHFKKGGSYQYTDEKPGAEQVREMKRLAESGDGLGAYINKFVRKNYSSKLE